MPPHRKLAAAAVGVWLVLAFTVFRPPSTAGPIERDFEAYYAAGVTVNAGGDPYSRAIWRAERHVPGVVAQRDELLPFVGPAAALPLWSLLARLPYRAAVVVWTMLLAAGLTVLIGAASRLSRARRDPYFYAIAGGATLASAPVIAGLALGQAALLSSAGFAAAIVAYRARWVAGAVAATLVTAIQPNLAFALIARVRSRWDVGVAACAGIAFAILTLAAGGGASGFVAYLQHLGAHGTAERNLAIQHTPAAIAYAFGLAPRAGAIFSALLALLAAAVTIAVAVRERLDATTATLVAGALLPFVIPFFHEPDFALEMLAILTLGMRARGRGRTLGALAAVLVLVDWFGLAQRPGAQGQIVCFGLAVACGFAGLNPSPTAGRRSLLAGVGTLALLAALAIPLGLLHPAPTWPDRLPAAYHAPPTLSASAVWAAEGQAAGLTRREPAWALLRSLPLAGCLLLAAALVTDARARRSVPPRQNGSRPATAGSPLLPHAQRLACRF